MKNYEKYADEIKRYKGTYFCNEFVKPNILRTKSCLDISCNQCSILQMLWLLEEYKDPEEPKVDWNKIKVDTPVLVRQDKNGEWLKRRFAKYENGLVYAWKDGCTSWTVLHDKEVTAWKYAKLAEDEVDWSKIEVDTAIYVKASKYGSWFKRHFAEYKNGKIYTWGNGLTSHDTSRMMEWKYAKLAENEEPEVDWSKVKVDTPILVRQGKNGEWLERHFAKYENGNVYAWVDGQTSWTGEDEIKWKFAKLAESEETK